MLAAVRIDRTTLAIAFLAATEACASPAAFDRVDLLQSTTSAVILPRYAAATERAGTLRDRTTELCADPSAQSLADAQAAWREAVLAWRGTRPFALIGEHLIVGVLDGELTTTADVGAIDAHVGSSEALDAPDYVAALGGASKGFFAIEYLLFAYPGFEARDDARTLAALADPRRCTYARVLAIDAAGVTAAAENDWRTTFAPVFGSRAPSTTYPFLGAAVDDLVSTIATAIDRTRSESLARPLGLEAHPGAVESPYGGASVALMRATLDSVRDTWTAPHGLDALLRTRDGALADEVLAEIDGARSALAALESPPLATPWERYVLGADHDAGNAAYDAVAMLLTTLGTEVGATLGISVTLLVDGD